MKKISDIDRGKLGLFGLAAAVVLFLCVNIVATFALKDYRADLTETRLYSLSEGSEEAVSKIKEPITIRFYLSEKLSTASQIHATYALRVLELLEQYVTAADGRIRLEVIDPQPFSKAEDEALAYGIKGIPIADSSAYVYMGLSISNASDRRRTIALLDPSRERFLEYDITKYLTDLTRAKRPVVGIISTMPIDGRGEPHLIYPTYQPRWAIMKQIREIFDVRFISRQTLDIPPDVDVLMIVNPKRFTDETLYAIDQYVMRGGNLIILADPYSEVEKGLGDASYAVAPDLEKLFSAWGVALETKSVVGDMRLAQTVSHTEDGKSVQVKYLPRLDVTEGYLSPEDPITNALGNVTMTTAGSFSVVEQKDGLTVLPLILSSEESERIKTSELILPDPSGMLRSFKSEGKNFVLGVRIKGVPESAFDRAPKRNFLKQRPEAHIEKALKPVNIVLIGDSDFLADRFWAHTDTVLGVDRIHPFAGNGDLVVNALDNLSGAVSLIDLRSKAEWRRPFVLLEVLARNAEQRYRARENEIMADLNRTQKELMTLTQKSSSDGDDLLSRTDMDRMQELRERLLALRSDLRAVQSVLTRDVAALQSFIVLLNVAFVPGLLAVVALFIAWRRKSRRLTLRKG